MDSISVVITNHDKGLSVLKAVESALLQLNEQDEIVFVDDASTDGSGDLAIALLEGSEFSNTVIRAPKKSGPGVSKNLGISHASNEIIVLIDGDDYIEERALSSIRSVFSANPLADFLFGDYLIRDVETGSEYLQSCASIADSDGWLAPAKLARSWILLGTSPFRRAVWKRFGGFGEKYQESDDIDFFRAAIGAGARGYYLPQQLYVWNRSRAGNNATATSAHKSLAWIRNWRFYFKFLPLRTFRAQLFSNLLTLARESALTRYPPRI